MDIEKVFPQLTLGTRETRSLLLSYRRYARLKDYEKKMFDKLAHGYSPVVRQIALHIKYKRKKSLKKRYFDIANKWVTTREWLKVKISLNYIQDRYLLKELTFQGFVEIGNIRINPKYGYFVTNRFIRGKLLVYPKKFSDNYYTLKKTRKPFYQYYMGSYGIPGIIKYCYSFDEKGMARIVKFHHSR